MAKKMKTRNAQPEHLLPVYDSIGAASGATTIPVEVFSKAKREGCPGFVGSRVRLKEFLTWYFGRDNESDREAMALRRARRIRAEELAKQEAINTETMRKELVAFEDMRSLLGKMIITCKTRLQWDVPSQASTEYGMKFAAPQAQIDELRSIISKHVRVALTELCKGELSGICPNCKTEIKPL